MACRRRYDIYNLDLELPRPLVPRHLRFGVPERVLADGTIAEAIDLDYVDQVARELVEIGVEKTVAISFLHSFTNPASMNYWPPRLCEPLLRVCGSLFRARSCQRSESTNARRPPLPTYTCKGLSSSTFRSARTTSETRVLQLAPHHAFQWWRRNAGNGGTVSDSAARIGTGWRSARCGSVGNVGGVPI